MKKKTQYEMYPSPIRFESDENGEWYTVVRFKTDKFKDVMNNPNSMEYQIVKKCINAEMITTGDWERLTGQERDCME